MSPGLKSPIAATAWFDNLLGGFTPPCATVPPIAVLDRARFSSHRTIFISDTHLGTRGCKAEALADFLAHNDCNTLFLVGDIVDGWQIKRRWFWSEAQSRVVAEILRKVDARTRVIFVPGVALRLNDLLFKLRRAFGLPYWSLSAFLKHKVKNAVEYISRFEEVVAHEAEMRGVDGVVCGHIHHAEIRRIGGVLYLNDGDWVESCSALVEDAHGNMEILRWADPSERLPAKTSQGPTKAVAAAASQGQAVPA